MKILRLRVNQISPCAYAYVTVTIQMRTFCPFVYALANPNDDVFAFVFRMFTWLLIVSHPTRLAYFLLTTACISSFRWPQLWHSDAENVWHPLPWYILSTLFAFELARNVGPHYVRTLRILVFLRVLSAQFTILANTATVFELLATVWYTGNQRFCVSLRNYPAVLVFALVASVVMHVQATTFRDVVDPHCDNSHREHTVYPRSVRDLEVIAGLMETPILIHSGSCRNTDAMRAVSSRFLYDCEVDDNAQACCLVGAHPREFGYQTASSLRSIGSAVDERIDASGKHIADLAIAYTVMRERRLVNISANMRQDADVVIAVCIDVARDTSSDTMAELAAPNATVVWENRTVRNVPSMCGPRPELLLTANGVYCPARMPGTPVEPIHPMIVELVDTVLPLLAFGVELCVRLSGTSLYDLSDRLHRRSYRNADRQFDLLHGRNLAALQITPSDDPICLQDVLRSSGRHVVLQCERAEEGSPDCSFAQASTVHFGFMPPSC
jgi:hypothetical protein